MPITTEEPTIREVPTRGMFSARWPALSIVAASVTTLVVVFAILNSPREETEQMQSVPAQPNTVSQWVAAPPPRPKPSPVAPRPQPAPVLAMDDHGFVDSTARCDADQNAVAIARTARSAMVVCQGADGSYEYEGIRLRDRAFLRIDDVRPIPAGFEAHNDGTTYRLSPTELVVITGEDLLSRDAVVEYRAG